MAGNSEDNAHPGPRDVRDAPPDGAHVIEGIRSLHDRIDELQRLVGQRLTTEGVQAGSWLQGHAPVQHQPHEMPAWRRRTSGEARWQVTICVAVAIALQVAVPDRLVLLRPTWVLPTVQGALLVALVIANPHRINRESQVLRMLSLGLVALLTFANAWSVERLVVGLVKGTEHWTAGQLLITGGAIWLTHVIVFGLWYWEFDRGGPVARALATKPFPDFQFPQMVSPPEMAPPNWEPAFADYLYVAFTNAAAFSTTYVMPFSRWAKKAIT